MHSRLAQMIKGLLAAVGGAAALVGPPAALIRLVGNPLPQQLPTWQEFTDAIFREGVSDGTVIAVLAMLAWAIWAQIALAIVVEAAAVVGGVPSPRLPLLPGIQSLAAHWLAVAALVAGPFAGGSPSGEPPPLAFASVVDDGPTAVADATAPTQPDEPPTEPSKGAPLAADQPQTVHVVERHDNLWDIAERYLGDPFRWSEIRDLNVGRLQPDGQTLQPDFETIQPGWRLLVPVASRAELTDAGTYSVEPGDHLWSIAETQVKHTLGRATTDDEVRLYWRKLIDLNRDQLIDPDNPGLIRPGQVFALPPADGAAPTEAKPHEVVIPDPPPQPAAADPEPEAPTTSTTSQPVTTQAAPLSSFQAPSSNGHAANEDASRSAIGTMLGIAGAVLSTGVLAAVRRRQRRRSLAAPHGHGSPPIPEEFATLRTELALRSDAIGQADLDGALATIGAHVIRTASLRHRRPVLVQLSDDRVEVLLDQPALPAPDGWQPQASGAVWASVRPVAQPGAPSPSPALVAVGADDGVDFMLDLEALGVVTVGGTENDVSAFARSVLLELVTKASGDAIALAVIGDIDLHRADVVRRCASWHEIEADVLAWAQQSRRVLQANRLPNAFAARSADRQLDGVAPLVVVCDSLPATEVFEEVRDLARAGAAVSVIVLGVGHIDGPHIHIEGGELVLDLIGLRCRPQGVESDAATAIEALVEVADRPAEQLAAFGEQDAIDLRDDPYVDPPHDVLVKVLGEIAVVGGHRALTPKETALLTFVALHDGCSVDRLEEAIWPTPMESRRRQLHNVVSQVRSALGADYLPASEEGRYTIGAKVRTDLDLLSLRASYASSQSPSQAIETLRGALELVDGPPFGYRHADRGSYAWVDLHHWSVTTDAKVVEVTWRLWQLCHSEGDFDGAIWAARRGLLASLGNAELTEALMRAYVASGDREAAEDVFVSHAKALDQLDQDEPAPTTLELWDEIRSSDADAR